MFSINKYFSIIKRYGIDIRLFLGAVAAISLVIFLGTRTESNRANYKLGANMMNSGIDHSAHHSESSAGNIYSLFFCPCCGKPLNPDDICCDMAKEMIAYIDSLKAEGLSEKEIILAYVKKYGLNSFVDKNKAEEFKKELADSAPAERPMITLSQTNLDLGDVSLKNGVANAYFTIKNDGQVDLIINNLNTSCGCTSASIVFQNQESPRFAMAGHGIESPKDWQIAIPPGEEAQLKIYYDPSVHSDFRGTAIREIYIYSNDPVNIEQKAQIELNQVD